jgi:hypothetical protein
MRLCLPGAAATSNTGTRHQTPPSSRFADRQFHLAGGVHYCRTPCSWHASDTTSSGRINFKWSQDGVAWTDGVANPVLLPGSAASDPDSWFVGDSVSGYRDGNSYRIMYTGYAEDLFGTEGRFEGICLASVTATCP